MNSYNKVKVSDVSRVPLALRASRYSYTKLPGKLCYSIVILEIIAIFNETF